MKYRFLGNIPMSFFRFDWFVCNFFDCLKSSLMVKSNKKFKEKLKVIIKYVVKEKSSLWKNCKMDNNELCVKDE